MDESTHRVLLSRNLSRERMRFQSYAFKCSAWKRAKPFSNVFDATSAALLTEFIANFLNCNMPIR
jgi:hypothetical protein